MEVVVLDSDTLSELARGNERVRARAREYLAHRGKLTFTAVTVFERLRGYHGALRDGKPYGEHLRQFESLVRASVVLPLDERGADRAARIWAALGRRARRALGDILIAAITSVHGLPLATRNKANFAPIAALEFVSLRLLDWSRP